MSGRHGRGSPDGQDGSQTAADVEASATATVIAGLRWRLRRRETLEHPKVLGELQKLEEQIADQAPDRLRPSWQYQLYERSSGGAISAFRRSGRRPPR
jgi:hypothetical protein